MVITVVQIPVDAGRPDVDNPTPVEEVIRRLGFPDEKTEHYISWPESETFDSIHYRPTSEEGVNVYHWKYREVSLGR